MKGFPESVTFEQMQEACRALGLPLEHVVSVSMGVREGVDVAVHVTDDEGQKLRHGGHPLVTYLSIPITRAEVDDAAADG